MNNRLLKTILFISLLMNFTILAAAGYFYCRDAGCLGFKPGRETTETEVLSKELGLTPEQRKAIEDMDAGFRKTMKENREKIIEKRRRVLELLKEDKPDREAIDSVLSEIRELQWRIQKLAVGHIIDEKSVFNKEQQAKFYGLLEKRLEKRKANADRGGGGL